MLMQGGYIRLERAIDLAFPDGTRVFDKPSYFLWLKMFLAGKGNLAKPWECHLKIYAEVRQGRWVAKCPNCGLHPYTEPQWAIICCGECGCVDPKVVVPKNYKQIEKELLRRPNRLNQNWLPGESLAQLRQEFREHN